MARRGDWGSPSKMGQFNLPWDYCKFLQVLSCSGVLCRVPSLFRGKGHGSDGILTYIYTVKGTYLRLTFKMHAL